MNEKKTKLCFQCGKRFCDKSGLNRHLREQHASQRKLYECPCHCPDVVSLRKDWILKHMRKLHPDLVIMYEGDRPAMALPAVVKNMNMLGTSAKDKLEEQKKRSKSVEEPSPVGDIQVIVKEPVPGPSKLTDKRIVINDCFGDLSDTGSSSSGSPQKRQKFTTERTEDQKAVDALLVANLPSPFLSASLPKPVPVMRPDLINDQQSRKRPITEDSPGLPKKPRKITRLAQDQEYIERKWPKPKIAAPAPATNHHHQEHRPQPTTATHHRYEEYHPQYPAPVQTRLCHHPRDVPPVVIDFMAEKDIVSGKIIFNCTTCIAPHFMTHIKEMFK